MSRNRTFYLLVVLVIVEAIAHITLGDANILPRLDGTEQLQGRNEKAYMEALLHCQKSPCLITKTGPQGSMSCVGRCGLDYDSIQPCQCDRKCSVNGDCCTDLSLVCGSSGTSDQELMDMSLKIWAADRGDRLNVSLNFQNKTDPRNHTYSNPPAQCAQPLFDSVPSGVYSNPLYTKLTALFPLYNRYENVSENFNSSDWQLVDEFLDQVMKSPTMRVTSKFLASKGLPSSDSSAFQQTLKSIWYGMYNRSNTVNSSSGAEHVQMGEVRGSWVDGLHNWVRFALLEQDDEVQYRGYYKTLDLGQAWLLTLCFTWNTTFYKAVGGFFVGTSPAFDLSVFTMCYFARPNATCPLFLNNHVVKVTATEHICATGSCVGTSFPRL